MAGIPPLVLDPLPLPQVRDGLFEAATGPLDLPEHAKTAGAIWETDADGIGHLYPAPCQAPPYPAMILDGPSGQVQAYPFNVYASEVMGTFGHSAQEAERRVRARLQLQEKIQVEAALWGGGGGVVGVFQQLNTAGKVANLAAATNTVEAVSALEQAAASGYAGPIALHARPRMAAYLSKNYLISDTAKVPTTFYGSRVVFGSGYAGTGPAGEAVVGTDEWMYATGRVIIWRDPAVWVSPPGQLIDRNNNQRGLYAVRTYAVALEYAASVKVTRA